MLQRLQIARSVATLCRSYHTAAVVALPEAAIGLRSANRQVPGREALLFTPGPLTTSATVKQAMLVDLGSRDAAFVSVVKNVRNRLLAAAGLSQKAGYECVIMQGSGTFGVEAVMTCAIPKSGAKLLVLINGAYGERIANIAAVHGIPCSTLRADERSAIQPDAVVKALKADPAITHVAVVHHETTTGLLNPVHEIGAAIQATRPGTMFLMDAVSSFGCYPVDMAAASCSFMVSSSNKCIEGVPGFAYVIAQRDALKATAGNSRTLSLNLLAQWEGLEGSGQFRFTPPTHSLLAFDQALNEFEAEGGAAGRLARYQHNFNVLKAGMAEMGFKLYLDDKVQSCIISTFLYPDDPKFDFPRLYAALARRGLVIYPGKLTKADCFRLGSIGRLFESDMKAVVSVMREELVAMGVKLPVRQITP